MHVCDTFWLFSPAPSLVSCTPLLSSFVLGAVVVPRVFSETMDLDFRLEPGELTFGYTAEDNDAPLPH